MNVAIIVAGGTGERAGLDGGKQLAAVAGRPVVSHALLAFDRCADIDAIIVVVHPDRIAEYQREAIDPVEPRKVVAVVGGGDTRQRSVASGLAATPSEAAIIAVHDGARPLITSDLISMAVRTLKDDESIDGVVVGHPSYDTIKVVDERRHVTGTPRRETLWAAQTPQVFRARVLRAAYDTADREGFVGSDDASLVERAGGTVVMLPGPRDNIKITVPEDLLIAGRLLEERSREASDG